LRKWLKALVVIVFVLVIGVGAYLSSRPHSNIEYVTSDVLADWADSTWEVEVPASLARIENDVFNATACKSSKDSFGASLIQQGDSPHGWWNVSIQHDLRKEITIYKDGFDMYPALVLDFVGKRISPIEWFDNNQSNRGSNIGILLVGDVGLDYYNNDTSEPRALFIDIWLDTNPEVYEPQNWTGVKNVENDYHSGFPVKTMAEVGKEYAFKFRIDTFIVDSLKHWNLEKFTLKMVQCYIEAKASRASVEVSRIIIST
jgi:hypothetical protein